MLWEEELVVFNCGKWGRCADFFPSVYLFLFIQFIIIIIIINIVLSLLLLFINLFIKKNKLLFK